VAGGTYAIDGHQERIGESIFLFTPNCVQVSTQLGVPNDIPIHQPQPRTARPTALHLLGLATRLEWLSFKGCG
ncbi:cell division protein SepF, partial [bacterium]|nr:cell division protein SepF [bacterium]